jgi:hypothetical protein
MRPISASAADDPTERGGRHEEPPRSGAEPPSTVRSTSAAGQGRQGSNLRPAAWKVVAKRVGQRDCGGREAPKWLPAVGSACLERKTLVGVGARPLWSRVHLKRWRADPAARAESGGDPRRRRGCARYGNARRRLGGGRLSWIGPAELFVYVDNVDRVVSERAEGNTILRAPKDMPWGERVAFVADPRGQRRIAGDDPLSYEWSGPLQARRRPASGADAWAVPVLWGSREAPIGPSPVSSSRAVAESRSAWRIEGECERIASVRWDDSP